MNKVNSEILLSFDDVLIEPRKSEVPSRLSPNTQTTVGPIVLSIPLISSPMESVTEWKMAYELGRLGGMGVIHRYMTASKQISNVLRVNSEIESNRPSDYESFMPLIPIALAVGVKDSERERATHLWRTLGSATISMFVIDVAIGHHNLTKDMLSFIKDLTHGEVPVMAGNVATGEGFAYLAEAGADAVRVGIGSGSICSTRIKTGFGIPLLSSLMQCYQVKQENPKYRHVSIIADGGIRYPADLVKSLVAGADAIIGGRIFATTNESPGETIKMDGRDYKIYRGMMSQAAMEKNGGIKDGTTAEGVTTQLPCSGPLKKVVDDFIGGLRSGMSGYANAMTIAELRECRFNRITENGVTESHAFGTRV